LFPKTLSFFTLFCLLTLHGCAGTDIKPIETVESFESRIDKNGQTQFAFGLRWKNSHIPASNPISRENSSNRRNNNNVTDRIPRNNNSRLAAQVDKQTKLELEDKAAASLAQKLKQEQLCEKGHTLEQVIWEEGRIRLMGYCL
jgi:hypothetical protein